MAVEVIVSESPRAASAVITTASALPAAAVTSFATLGLELTASTSPLTISAKVESVLVVKYRTVMPSTVTKYVSFSSMAPATVIVSTCATPSAADVVFARVAA